MKKPFLHALGAVLYIVVIVFFIHTATTNLSDKPDTIFAPMAMLSLFVLSAAVMGFLFLSQPLQLLVANQKKEALTFFGQTVGFFAGFVLLFVILLFLY